MCEPGGEEARDWSGKEVKWDSLSHFSPHVNIVNSASHKYIGEDYPVLVFVSCALAGNGRYCAAFVYIFFSSLVILCTYCT